MSATKSSEQADRPRTIRPKLSHSHTVDVVIVASPPGYVMRVWSTLCPFLQQEIAEGFESQAFELLYRLRNVLLI